MAKTYRRLTSQTTEINIIQDNVENAFSYLLKDPFTSATLLKNVKLVAGQDNIINHLLGRNLIGWILVRKRGPGDIWDKQDENTIPNLTLILNTSQDVVVDLRVY